MNLHFVRVAFFCRRFFAGLEMYTVHSQVSPEKYEYRNDLIIISSVPVYDWIWMYRGIRVGVVLISTSVKKKKIYSTWQIFILLVHVIASCLSNICTTTGSLVGMCNCKPKYQWLSKQAIYIERVNCFISNRPITIREIQKYRPCKSLFITTVVIPQLIFGIVI